MYMQTGTASVSQSPIPDSPPGNSPAGGQSSWSKEQRRTATCPKCLHHCSKTKTNWLRSNGSLMRSKKCLHCGHVYRTIEIAEEFTR